MKTIRFSFVLFLICLAASLAYGQEFEIRAVATNGSVITVEMRETSGTTPSSSDFLTDLVFGLKWDATYNVDLQAVDNSPGYNMVKSGGRSTNGGFNFQAFGANATPFNFPASWVTGEWTPVMSIRNTLDGSVETGTFQITEIGFDVTTEPNIGVNLVDYTPTINGEANGVVLPTDLVEFQGEQIGKSNHINWKTINELDMWHYEVERSLDGIIYTSLGEVTAHNQQAASYQFHDRDLPASNIFYYRLKMVDLDGTYSMSWTIDVSSENQNNTVAIYPNPTSEIVTIETIGDYSASIQDQQGRTIATYHSLSGIETISVSTFPSGTYTVLIYQGKNRRASSAQQVIVR